MNNVIKIDPLYGWELCQENIYFHISIFDFCAKALVLRETARAKDITDDNKLREEFIALLDKAMLGAKISKHEADRAKILFSVVHNFLHGNFSSFLKEANLLEDESGFLVKLGALPPDGYLALSSASDDELYAWMIVLTQNHESVIRELQASIVDLKKIGIIYDNLSVIVSLKNDASNLFYALNQLGVTGGHSNELKLNIAHGYYQACVAMTKFEIKLRVLATNLGINTFRQELSSIMGSIILSQPDDNLSTLEMCLFIRNRIRHPQLVKGCLPHSFVRISSLIEEAKKITKNGQPILPNHQQIVKNAIEKDRLEYNGKLYIEEVGYHEDAIYRWFSDNDWFIPRMWFDAGLNLIDYCLLKISL